MKNFLLYVLAFCCISCFADAVPLADPFILFHENKYYAYGTYAGDGIAVFVSEDLKNWNPAGLALSRDDVWGNHSFWAPEVYKVDDGFLMYYSAEEHICAAKSDSPLGPFVQDDKKPMIQNEKAIDHTLFVDDDGTPWIFFVRFDKGNHIWCAQLEKDLVSVKLETMKLCISPSEQEWEHREGHVNEGAAVIKHNGKYYLSYSGNDYTSKFYGIGYAAAENPDGKYVKSGKNPIYQQIGSLSGVGHHSFFRDKDGNLRVVFHSHYSNSEVHPRLMHITTASFVDDKLVFSPDFFTPQIENPSGKESVSD